VSAFAAHRAHRAPLACAARTLTFGTMCGRIIQSSGPYSIVDGMNVGDSRVHNYPPRWNAAPSQDLLVIRRNHQTGETSLDPLRWNWKRMRRDGSALRAATPLT
jgi:hypothetical protein